MSDFAVERFYDPMSGKDWVRVRVDGEWHKRGMNPYDDADSRALRTAAMYWNHGDMLTERLEPSADRDAAVLVDRCLAVEALFPHLRDALPV